MGSIAAHARLWLVAVIGLAVDLATKNWAFAALDHDDPLPVMEGLLEFRRSLNAGAVFGLGTGLVWVFIVASVAALGFVLFLFNHSAPRQRVLHVALGMILAGALGNLYDRVAIQADVVEFVLDDGSVHRQIGLYMEGAPEGYVRVGSWPDRAGFIDIAQSRILDQRRQGVVRDFIKFTPRFPAGLPLLGGHDLWPWIFNVADALLVCGVGILMVCFWRTRHPSEASATVESTAREAPQWSEAPGG